MAKVDKYYGTNINWYFPKIRDFGYAGSHNQFRIVCKAKSMAEANRIAASLGLTEKTFRSAFTGVTGNEVEIQMADQLGFVINVNGTSYPQKYIDIKLVL